MCWYTSGDLDEERGFRPYYGLYDAYLDTPFCFGHITAFSVVYLAPWLFFCHIHRLPCEVEVSTRRPVRADVCIDRSVKSLLHQLGKSWLCYGILYVLLVTLYHGVLIVDNDIPC